VTTATRPPGAVTVDLDDTLFPQSSWLAGAWRAVAEAAGRHGLDAEATHAALVAVAALGSDRGGIIDRALADLGGDPSLVPDLVAAFTHHAPDALPFYPGAADALRRLRAAGVAVAVVTDGNPVIQNAKVRALSLLDLVDTVVVSDELGGRALRKPHPAAFVEALHRLAVAPPDAVHIGDRPAKDTAGAAAVGMRCIRVRTGEYGHLEEADSVPRSWRAADTLAEAVALLLGPA
jgi:HAD superfamily hydrolase (TIGR01662 family)